MATPWRKMMSKEGTLEELLEQVEREDLFPIFVGMVAVCKDGTLMTWDGPFTAALKEVRSEIESVPETFRQAIEALTFYKGHYGQTMCRQTKYVFFAICDCFHPIIHWVDDKDFGSRFIYSDTEALQYVQKRNWQLEDIEWLWKLAQKAHVSSVKPVEKRQTLWPA